MGTRLYKMVTPASPRKNAATPARLEMPLNLWQPQARADSANANQLDGSQNDD